MFYNFGRNHLRLEDLYTVRFGHGVGSAPRLTGYADSTVLWWTNTGTPQVIEQHAENNTLNALNWQSWHPDQWRQIRWIQFARVAEETHVAVRDQTTEQTNSPAPSEPREPSVTGRLSTIPEEASDDMPRF